MAFFKIRMAVAVVEKLQDPQALWQIHGGPCTLLGRVIVKSELTEEEIRSLPEDLRELTVSEIESEVQDDSVVFLERLFSLDDPRA
jgi:hypothetical protein